jgi:hypothetical protein
MPLVEVIASKSARRHRTKASDHRLAATPSQHVYAKNEILRRYLANFHHAVDPDSLPAPVAYEKQDEHKNPGRKDVRSFSEISGLAGSAQANKSPVTCCHATSADLDFLLNPSDSNS